MTQPVDPPAESSAPPTVLLIARGEPLAPALVERLSAQSVHVELAGSEGLLASVRAVQPHVIVLAGKAARDVPAIRALLAQTPEGARLDVAVITDLGTPSLPKATLLLDEGASADESAARIATLARSALARSQAAKAPANAPRAVVPSKAHTTTLGFPVPKRPPAAPGASRPAAAPAPPAARAPDAARPPAPAPAAPSTATRSAAASAMGRTLRFDANAAPPSPKAVPSSATPNAPPRTPAVGPTPLAAPAPGAQTQGVPARASPAPGRTAPLGARRHATLVGIQSPVARSSPPPPAPAAPAPPRPASLRPQPPSEPPLDSELTRPAYRTGASPEELRTPPKGTEIEPSSGEKTDMMISLPEIDVDEPVTDVPGPKLESVMIRESYVADVADTLAAAPPPPPPAPPPPNVAPAPQPTPAAPPHVASAPSVVVDVPIARVEPSEPSVVVGDLAPEPTAVVQREPAKPRGSGRIWFALASLLLVVVAALGGGLVALRNGWLPASALPPGIVPASLLPPTTTAVPLTPTGSIPTVTDPPPTATPPAVTPAIAGDAAVALADAGAPNADAETLADAGAPSDDAGLALVAEAPPAEAPAVLGAPARMLGPDAPIEGRDEEFDLARLGVTVAEHPGSRRSVRRRVQRWLLDAYRARSRDDLDAAEERYRRVLGVDPENPRATAGLSLVQSARGDHRTALLFAQRLARLRPYANNFALVGDRFRDLGDIDAARRAYTRALELEPGHDEATAALAALP